jgi:hypothetical protein
MAKISLRITVLFIVLTSFAANAQWSQGPPYQEPPQFSHIVFIIQENRTPDTLFGGPGLIGTAVCGDWNGFASGVDLANGGQNEYVSACTPLQLWPDLECGGGNHSHTDWECQYDTGKLDGACGTTSGTCVPNTTKGGTGATCNKAKATCGPTKETAPKYSPYIAIEQPVVQPYVSLAENYGWANYMFQTNQGPSFPAHQFLFSGTSAGTWPGDMYFKYFVSENPGFLTSGCDVEDYSGGTSGPNPGQDWIDPTGKEHKVSALTKLPTFLLDGYQCYDHNTLVTTSPSPTGTVTASGSVSWRYYAQQPGIIWNAPESLTQTCYSSNSIPTATVGGNTVPASCGPNSSTGLDEYANVSFPVTSGPNATGAPILNDIQNCNLQQISWVTPDEAWSDHPGDDITYASAYRNLGPSWVAVILDAIGQSATNSSGTCDYWGNSSSDTATTSIEPTAVFVVWDDWGGFYDHVPPPGVNVGTEKAGVFSCTNSQGGSWGCGYTYGFRVPLLVASEYTSPGTVSGKLSTNAVPSSYPFASPNLKPWVHDFGSLLNFTEQNFGLPKIAPAGYTYADANTFDTIYNGNPAVPLWEFFTSYPTKLPFTSITPGTNPQTGVPYTANFFETYYQTTDAVTGARRVPTGPDNDGDED